MFAGDLLVQNFGHHGGLIITLYHVVNHFPGLCVLGRHFVASGEAQTVLFMAVSSSSSARSWSLSGQPGGLLPPTCPWSAT